MSRLDTDDSDTLIVSCDWLLWQKAAAAKRHCVHYELGILDWTEPDAIDADLYIRSNDWIYRDGRDMTRFRGISLGAAFGSDLCWCLVSYFRIEKSLRKLIERFRPEEILFFDYSNDINVLGRNSRKRLVQALAGEYGVTFTDRSGGEPTRDSVITAKLAVPLKRRVWARALLYLYASALEAVSNLRALFSDSAKRVLVLVNTNVTGPLVRNFTGGLTPIFVSRTVPRKPSLLFNCLRRGIILANVKETPLASDDLERLDVIRDTLEQTLANPKNLEQEIVFGFVRERILDSGSLTRMATDIRNAERLVDRYKPSRIIVDGVRANRGRFFAEVARHRGIAVDYIWHSPLTPRSRRLDALGGDPRVTPLVTRNLTWGKVNEAWLDEIQARQPRITVGSPMNDRYGRTKEASSPGTKNVLLLQYSHNSTDLRAVSHNMYSHFILCLRLLRELGYSNIHFKMHPGPDKWKKSYFEEIARYFGLDCPILMSEPFDECVKWADMVIGPIVTGAMFETLATSKPYHAFLVPPHSMSPEFYAGYPILSSVDELADALERPLAGPAAKLLNDVCSVNKFPRTSQRFWEVLKHDFA